MLLVVVVLTGCARGPGVSEGVSGDLEIAALRVTPTRTPGLAGLDEIILRGIAERRYPGAVCVVGRVAPGDGAHTLLYAQAFGYTTYATGGANDGGYVPVGLDALFDLASVTKLVGTTSAALLMIGDGRLALDTPVATYLPGFAAEGKGGVTVRHLMTHTSGLPAYESAAVVERGRDPAVPTSDALVAHYAAMRPLAEPGARYTYSCLNFQTLARLVEEVADQPLEDLLRERLFGPLGMRDTTWRPTPRQLERTAPAYRDGAGRPVAGTVHDPLARYHGSDPRCPGNAGLYSTAPDLARWCVLVLRHGRAGDRQLLDAALLAEAMSVQTDPAVVGERRGLGFDVYESEPYAGAHHAEPGHHVVGHSGYTGTLVLIDRHAGVYMVLLTSRTFPAEPTARDQTRSINDIRRACWSVVRRYTEAAP